MIKRHRLLLSICGFIFAAGLALGLAPGSSPVYANVTLDSFTATFLPGEQAIRVDWKTASELATVGFYIARSDSSTGPFGRVSSFIPHTGDVVGATYVFTDGVTVLNRTYYYLLEAMNADQTIDPHGPITVTASVPGTNTLTPTRTPTATSTRTRTPTFTPSSTSTATPTTQPSADVSDPPATSRHRVEATPRPATGATITPRPTSTSVPPSPVVVPATPTLVMIQTNSQSNAPIATSLPPLSNASPLATAVALPSATHVLQASVLVQVPAEAASGVAAPVVIATEAVPLASPADSTHGEALVLIVAAILFLGIAFVILRQARR